ncbi:DUF4293 family protein [Pedobacter sp. BS3]|uniref:DUF4293 domain-containing protein n=1 Tax=Pedobacter sp. BS3 TaxID=2567937 RepID=UPI0011EF1873|nr:DUF4293 domain-containing protein [Pedobacter sp. BS3]TZF81174.1 DUF4293 family protein [Pedobacter sp. BS3]
MIQRIQSIWLILASLSLFCLFLFPFIQFVDIDGLAKTVRITGLYQHTGQEDIKLQEFIPLTIVTVIIALVPLVILGSFRNRKKQLTLSYITIVLILAYSFWLVQTAKAYLNGLQLQLQNYGIGVILPSLSILFIILAIRGIRHDEKLVKSADRLR